MYDINGKPHLYQIQFWTVALAEALCPACPGSPPAQPATWQCLARCLAQCLPSLVVEVWPILAEAAEAVPAVTAAAAGAAVVSSADDELGAVPRHLASISISKSISEPAVSDGPYF